MIVILFVCAVRLIESYSATHVVFNHLDLEVIIILSDQEITFSSVTPAAGAAVFKII